MVLLLFVGLALDAGSVYVTYGSLKRAVDSAALAAINEFKRDPDLPSMTAAAEEVFNLMNVDFANIEVLLCDADKDNIRDTGLPPIFYARCPNTPTEAPRKLVWVEAQQKAPLYFLSLMGFESINLHTNSQWPLAHQVIVPMLRLILQVVMDRILANQWLMQKKQPKH